MILRIVSAAYQSRAEERQRQLDELAKELEEESRMQMLDPDTSSEEKVSIEVFLNFWILSDVPEVQMNNRLVPSERVVNVFPLAYFVR